MIWSSLPLRIKILLISSAIVIVFAAAFRAEMSERAVTGDFSVGNSGEFEVSAFPPSRPKVSDRLSRFVDSFVRVGTSTLLSEDAPISVIAPSAPKPPVNTITAASYLVGNLETGEIYFSLEIDRAYAIASITKLVTVLVARNILKPDQLIPITPTMLEPYGEEGGLRLGDTLTASELTYPLILESSNDAAEALAEAAGMSVFISEMNALVSRLGMKKTYFDEPSGLSPGDVSSARDLFTFAQHLYKNEQLILELTRLYRHELATTTATTSDVSASSTTPSTVRGGYAFKNTNPFVGDPHYIGGKTGRTNAALESMLSMFRYEVKGKSYPVAIIVLRSQIGNRQYDSATLYSRLMSKLESK